MSAKAASFLPELALVAGLCAVAVTPSLASGFAAVGLAWLWWRAASPPRRESAWLGAMAVGALLALVAGTVAEQRGERMARLPTAALESGYRSFWEGLRRDADRLAAALDASAGAEAGGPFRTAAAVWRAGRPERTYLVIDPAGEIVAWAGPGTLHRLEPGSLRAGGTVVRRSATSSTLAAWRDVPGARWHGYRVVAAESRALDESPPLELGDASVPRWHHWRVVPVGSAGAGERLGGGAVPFDLLLEGPADPARSLAPFFGRAALALLGCGLFGLASLRALGITLLSGTVLRDPRRALAAFLLGTAGLLAIARGVGAGRRETALLAAGCLLVALGWRLARGTARVRITLGTVALLAMVAGVALLAANWPETELGLVTGLSFDMNAGTLRLGLVLAIAGALLWLPARGPGWQRASRALLAAVLISGLAWEVGARFRLRDIAQEELARLLPPEPERLASLAGGIERYFASVAGRRALPGREALDERGDLAYALWRRSPLARPDALSALVLELDGERPTTFSYGLPLTDEGRLDPSPARWAGLLPAAYRERAIEGSVRLAEPDRGVLHYWLVPRPGFGPQTRAIEDLAADLLRWSGARRRSDTLPTRSPWVLYSARGDVELSPWREGTPSFQEIAGASDRAIATPDGRLRALTRREGALVAALFLRSLRPAATAERIGMHVAGGLAALAAVALGGLLMALPRALARDLVRRTVRSYSKRLILIYSLLILVPLGLLYGLLSRSLGQRVVREQRLAAEAALNSAQRVLGEYVLSLEPGFGVGTALDDALLEWLSRVVGHEIHLYWGGEVYASSKRELFVAGLLPRRLPAEAQARLALAGESLVSRAARAGRAEYEELYAPLAVPGTEARKSSLVLAMPLLAQQEEAIAETELIRRRTLLATLAAFLLLAALGTRLARAFTRPITELVSGTQRIAAGASSLGVRPSGLELAALAEAIDQMARRIAEGRAHLMREKRLVDGIVEAVTSAVVYVDRSGLVVLANRQARELLAVEPGDRLLERLELRPPLAPAARFVGAAGDLLRQETVRLAPARGEARDWALVWMPLAGGGEPGFLFIVEDISEVLKAQRLAAWAEMARIIAHEIKNPLTPIRLSTEHLREVWTRDREHFEAAFERCTGNILKQVEELRGIASEFSTYSHIPAIERKPGDLGDLVREVVEMYGAAPPPGVALEIAAAPGELMARFDARLLARALRNLLENAVRASAGKGSVSVAVRAAGDRAEIRVADEGPGVPEELLSRIFEPYFSTHAGGTGLGLPIARRIVEEHGGTLTASNRASGGLDVVITIPLR